MIYAAAFSLRDSLERFRHSSDRFPHIHFPVHSLPLIERLYQISKSIPSIDFENYHHPQGEFLEKQIRDALWKAEDVIESFFSNRILSSECDIVEISDDTPSNFTYDLLQLVQEIESAKEKILNFGGDEPNHREEDSFPLAAYLLPQSPKKMVGLEPELEELKRIVLGKTTQQRLGAIVIHGMGGIGKTALAQNFYNNSDVRSHFCIGARIRIPFQFCIRDILLCLLHTVEFLGEQRRVMEIRSALIQESFDEGLVDLVRDIFAAHRFLLVVDYVSDVDNNSWNYIRSLVPDSNDGSRIIMVNRRRIPDDEFLFYFHRKRFLDASPSWELLCEQVFGDEPCSLELERIGKRIAKNCQGLPLAIITTGVHLSKGVKTAEYWIKVAESGNSIAYADDGEPMFEQLGLSYKLMPFRLRPVFLYMGAFPESHKIPFQQLPSLWIAEGFVRQEEYGSYKGLSARWLLYFHDRDLITIDSGENAQYTCCVHHALWHFCCYQAKKDEFFHVVDKYIDDDWEDGSPPGMNINNLRRMVIRKNVIFGVQDFSELENPFSTIRSLLFTGPYHPYPLRICWSIYKILRVLDASSLHFYQFPAEILYLALLRHLALTLNEGELPVSISKLRNLQFLIIHLHQIVRSFRGAPKYLPTEIWEMRQLIRLHVDGSDLPVPPHSDSLLPNLSKLGGVSPHSCTKEVLERIPNLASLEVSINLAPEKDDTVPWSPFDHLLLLPKLDSLNCVVNNPYFIGYISQPLMGSMPDNVSVFMGSLTCLTLNGCGFSWESIKPISQLPFLQFLLLQCHSFRGPEWELTNNGFKQLHVLGLEDLDLVYWTASTEEFFPCLRQLTFTRCHKLQKISSGFERCHHLHMIEVRDSSSAVETWASSMQTERSQEGGLSIMISSPRLSSTSGYLKHDRFREDQ